MSETHIAKEDVNRLIQEAEFYEEQGLYDHAASVYENVLKMEPENRTAQAKVVQIQFHQKNSSTSETQQTSEDAISPRLAFDLGIAYLGMKLYSEALDEFKKALKPSPVFRVEILRYTVVCLVHMRKFANAEKVLKHVMEDPAVTVAEKSDILQDVAAVYLALGAKNRLEQIMETLPRELGPAIAEALQLFATINVDLDVGDYELVVDDTETGLIYAQPVTLEEPGPAFDGAITIAGEPPESIVFVGTLSYSLDSRKWNDGSTLMLSPKWVTARLPEKVSKGDSVILQINLPIGDDAERIWIIARVGDETPAGTTTLEFVSFLPGGENILKKFIEETARAMEASAQSGAVSEPISVFAALEEQAIRELESGLLPEMTEESEKTDPASLVKNVLRKAEAAAGKADPTPQVRFACECGQVHLVPIRNVGRKGKCGSCGSNMVVPLVDMRPDSLAAKLIGKVVGGCRLLFKLGGGGMGGVFRAHHIALDIPVAVKILHSHLADKDPVFVKRFIREARAAAKLQHPNIVGVMNVGFENGLHFLIMPYVGGGSAAVMLARQGRFRLEKALHVAIDIARALTVAEEQGMLHRDIKPANILFTPKGDAMLADLGLAKNYLEDKDTGITQTGIACGTPLYFSPEQAKGNPNMDIRSDIYSLGITIYHLLEGSPPFKGESAYVIFQKHVHEPLPPFKDADPPVPDAVYKMLQKMTAKDPEQRHSSARELLAALERLRDDLLHSADPPKPKKKGLLERLGFRRSS